MEELKEFQEFVGVEEQRIIKHCPTRWLSLSRCLPRLITQYKALESYFGSQPDVEKPRSKVANVFNILHDPLTLACLHFIEFLLQPYGQFNQKFQVHNSYAYGSF